MSDDYDYSSSSSSSSGSETPSSSSSSASAGASASMSFEDFGFDGDRVQELKDAFSLFDKDGDGTISKSELGTLQKAVAMVRAHRANLFSPKKQPRSQRASTQPDAARRSCGMRGRGRWTSRIYWEPC